MFRKDGYIIYTGTIHKDLLTLGLYLKFIQDLIYIGLGFRFMVFNTTFNNISVLSWRSVVLVEDTGVPTENHRPVASH